MKNSCVPSGEPCDNQQLTFNIFELTFFVIAVSQSDRLRVNLAGYKRLLSFLTASWVFIIRKENSISVIYFISYCNHSASTSWVT